MLILIKKIIVYNLSLLLIKGSNFEAFHRKQTCFQCMPFKQNKAVYKINVVLVLDVFQIARDLIRFLRCIAADDLESPPRSPTFIKSHHNPNLSPSATVSSDDVSYLVNTHPRSVSASSRGSLTRGNSLDKGSLTRNSSTDKLGSLSRSGSDKARKSLMPISPTLTSPLK